MCFWLLAHLSCFCLVVLYQYSADVLWWISVPFHFRCLYNTIYLNTSKRFIPKLLILIKLFERSSLNAARNQFRTLYGFSADWKGSIIEGYRIIVECRGVENIKLYWERGLWFTLFGTRTEVHHIPKSPLSKQIQKCS